MNSHSDDTILGAHRKIYRPSSMHDVECLLSKCDGLARYEVDLRGLSSKAEWLEAIAEAMAFPDYFGMNWDALDECLAEVVEAEASGIVLCVQVDDETGIAEDDWRMFVEVVQGVARATEGDHGKVFVLVLTQ